MANKVTHMVYSSTRRPRPDLRRSGPSGSPASASANCRHIPRWPWHCGPRRHGSPVGQRTVRCAARTRRACKRRNLRHAHIVRGPDDSSLPGRIRRRQRVDGLPQAGHREADSAILTASCLRGAVVAGLPFFHPHLMLLLLPAEPPVRSRKPSRLGRSPRSRLVPVDTRPGPQQRIHDPPRLPQGLRAGEGALFAVQHVVQ